MSDFMREEFSEWLLDIHGLESEWQEARNCFKDFPAHLAYQAWKASRECQVIKLPERMEFASKGGDYFDGARNGFNQCLDACAISLKLSGIKVKP